jgi:hypothetical protein
VALELGELDVEDLQRLAVLHQLMALGETNRCRICSVVGRAQSRCSG